MAGEWLQKLHVQYVNMRPVRKMHWNENESEFTPDLQKKILETTIFHPLAVKFPPANKYTRNFIKMLIRKIEEKCLEVNEEIYNCYLQPVEEEEQKGSCFRTYYSLSLDLRITLEESTNLLSNGTTGLQTWEASLYLAEWCIQNKNLMHGRKILELGSGIGFAGIVVSTSCNPSLYCFSDVHPEVLDKLEKNIQLNLRERCINNHMDHPQTSGSENSAANSSDDLVKCDECRSLLPVIKVKELDWTKTNHNLNDFDVILAADVIYDPDLSPHLVNTLHDLLQVGNTAFISCTVRNIDTVNKFLHELDESDIQYNSVVGDIPQTFDYSRSPVLVLWKLQKTNHSSRGDNNVH